MQVLYRVLQYVPLLTRLLGLPNLRTNLRRMPRGTGYYSNELAHSAVFRHACKTPLTALMMSLSDLQNRATQNTAESKHLVLSDTLRPVELSLTATRRLMSLLDELESESPSIRSFDVSSALQEVRTLLTAQQPDCQLYFHLYLQPNCRIRGAQLHFEEALMCLVTNAIEAYDQTQEPRIVVVLAYQPNSSLLRIEVLDFGAGMTDAVKRLAMLSGVTSKEQGSGVGLSFARNVAERVFAGQLTVVSQVGLGTRVRMELPLALDSDTQTPAP